MIRTLANGERWERRGTTWHMLNEDAADRDYSPVNADNFNSYASVIAAGTMTHPRPTTNLNRQRELCEQILSLETDGKDASASAVELARLALAYLDYREWDFRSRDS